MPATESYLRNIKTVHVVFAISSIVMLATTIWMMAADHAREWVGYQRTFEKVQAKKQIAAKEFVLDNPQYKASKEELTEQKNGAIQQIKSIQPEVDKLTEELRQAELEFDLASRKVRVVRAQRDKARADFDLGIRDQKPKAQLDDLQKDFDKKQAIVATDESTAEDKQTIRDGAQKRVKAVTKSRDDAEAALTKLSGEIDLRNKALEKLDPGEFSKFSAAKKAVMEWPIINGFNSPLKITQDWLPTLTIQLGMARTARFDRCRSCHQGIDRVEPGNFASFPFGNPHTTNVSDWVLQSKYPQPFATHPRPELYLTGASPHPLQKFGCTICHDGQGSATSFTDASHTPNDPNEYQDWHAKHHYASNHFWEYPMQPERLRESTCLKCHHSVVELGVHPKYGASAPKVYKGYNLIKEFGCFGCHEIQGFDGTRPIGPDMRLEPSTEAEADRIAADPTQIAGTLRKVGPSLRHISSKATGEFINYWVENPQRFRPTTRMPRFFHLTNQDDPLADRLQPMELVGISRYLLDKSLPFDLMSPEKGYKPNASRGKDLFSKRGCLACHSHEAFPETHADFGPDLSRVHGKLRPGQDGFRWLYSWVRDPQRYHRRTRMPNTFLETYDEGGEHIDPAADIAAFLFQKGAEKFPRPTVNQKDLDDLVMLHLAKTLKFEDAKKVLETRKYPVPKAQVRGDEIELIADANTPVSDGQWQVMRLNYVGRRTISRYGCYGCHDIPNFELARPIGTALQDWGRKDTSRLAPEHIDEYLEHHGEPNPAHPSTHDRIVSALKAAAAGGTATGMFKGNQEQTEMRAAYYYNDLIHHGRAGFFWQKLRDPRSYDYEKIQTKGYDERLRMPQFPFNEEQIEAIATFVLGLVADPPAKEYLYRPDGAAKARIEGERMIDRFNCSGCHMLEMPKIRYGADPGEITASLLSPADQPASLDLLLKLKPPDKAVTHMTVPVKTAGGEKRLPVVQFEGLIYGRPDPADPPEEQEYAFDLWDTLDVNGKIVFPSSRMLVKRTQLVSDATLKDGYATPPRGGSFAEWLVERMMATVPGTDRGRAWQMGPPPLYKEGTKVQTPWLYQFIREPYRLRHTTVLRMPRFNMSAEEAQTLANYFPAMDGSPFPYQKIAERDPEYLAGKEKQLKKYLGGSHQAYLADSWKALNANACIKCHSLAGRQVKIGDPVKDIRGPDLEYVTDRLRPDWLLLWLYNPKWITPYTSMPQAFAKNQPPKEGELAHLFGADPELQVIATRDALMNYHRLMEEKGTAEGPSASPPAAPAKKVSSSTSNKSSARGQE